MCDLLFKQTSLTLFHITLPVVVRFINGDQIA